MKKITFFSALILCFVSSAYAADSLYQRLGGAVAISAVVDEFVARASTNPKVNFTRQGHPRQWIATPETVAQLKKHLVAFIGSATGGPEKYQGRDMKTAHAQMRISEAEFSALADDLVGALDKFKVPKKEKDELLAIVGTTKKDIVESDIVKQDVMERKVAEPHS